MISIIPFMNATLATALIFSSLFLNGQTGEKSYSMDGPLTSFATGGHSVYHLQPATVNGSGSRVIISAAFDGAVLCHYPNGELIWKNESNKDFPFDLAVADINNDGLDESFIATAGGKVHAYKPDGSLLWTFSSTYPLYQVCPVKLTNGDWHILSGGTEKKVFNLSSTGVSLNSFAAGAVVRHIRKGNIMGNGNEYAAVATTTSGLDGNLSLILLNPNDMTQVWNKSNLGVSNGGGRRFFSMIVTDTDKNGKDNIIVSNSWLSKGLLYGFDENGTQMLSGTTNDNVPGASYRMPMLVNVDVPGTDNDNIFSVFANELIIYNANGTFNSLIDAKYDFSNGAYDPQNNTFYLGSSPSGGDGIYAFNLGHTDWKNAFKTIKPVGVLSEVEANLALLKTQVAAFIKPSYQRDPEEVLLITQKPSGTTPSNLMYGGSVTLAQNKISGELWCKSTDNRVNYNKTQDQIWADVSQREANKQNFVLWAGHGKAMYMSLSTMEGIITRAPNYFKGFVFAEMEQTDGDMKRIINEIIFPLAEKCSSGGKKIYFRNKNIFWSGTCYLQFYKDVLLNPRFHDVFVPSLEETNCRTQEMSLAGRVGLWMTGSFDSWGARTVTDNACFDRMWEWSSQQVMSHYIRKMAMRASLGADFYLNDIHQARFEYALEAQLVPFYDMLGKGVIAVPKREDVLSVPDVCLGMKIPPHNGFLSSGANGHGHTFSTNAPRVFDRLDTYWGAAPLTEFDFSGYGYGVERRMLNFLPKCPYGLVTIVPEDVDLSKHKWLKEKIITDGASFYNPEGVATSATDYKSTVLEKLEASANRLAVRVTGDAAWTVVRLDASHVRVSLFDPGYTDPGNRNATIVLQHLNGLKAYDILSGQELTITNQTINTTVPAGSMRFIDIEYGTTEVKTNRELNKFRVYPNPTNRDFTIELGETQGEVTVNILDITGKTISSEKHINHNQLYKLSLSIPIKGFYIVEAQVNGVSYRSKLVIR